MLPLWQRVPLTQEIPRCFCESFVGGKSTEMMASNLSVVSSEYALLQNLWEGDKTSQSNKASLRAVRGSI